MPAYDPLHLPADDADPDALAPPHNRALDLEDDDSGPDPFAPPLPDGEIERGNLQLEKIPRRLWEQVLAPIPRQWRVDIAHRVPDEHLRDLAIALIVDLDFAEMRRTREGDAAHHRARRTSAPLPSPSADHPVAKPTVQVNLRLRRDDYARLQEAATAVGLKPTTLARALVLNGARKVLDDGGAT